MSNIGQRGRGLRRVSVLSDSQQGQVGRYGVWHIAPSRAKSTGGVRPSISAPIVAMADLIGTVTADAQDKGLTGVRDWSPPA